jgi:tetratricopeptide (TPR) repeat protein
MWVTWVLAVAVVGCNGQVGRQLGETSIAQGERWVAKDDYGKFVVVVSPQAAPREQEAATLFQQRWKDVTGHDIPKQEDKGTTGQYSVYIGAIGVDIPMLLDMGLAWGTAGNASNSNKMDKHLTLSGLTSRGFAIKTLGNSLLIIGGGSNGNGTYNGVDYYFKKYLGVAPDNFSSVQTPLYLPIIRDTERVVPPASRWGLVLLICLMVAALFLIHFIIDRYYGGEIHYAVAALLTLGAIGCCGFIFKWFLELLSATWGEETRPMAPILTFAVCFWPMQAYAMLLIGSFGKRTTEFLYGHDTTSAVVEEEYALPKVFSMSEEVNTKVQEYRGIFGSDPSTPRPLFEAAQLLEHSEYFEEAAETYREVIQIFHKDDGLWSEASFRLASLHENSLFNRQGAIEIFKRIVDRAPDSEYGRLAAARLADEGIGGTTSDAGAQPGEGA